MLSAMIRVGGAGNDKKQGGSESFERSDGLLHATHTAP